MPLSLYGPYDTHPSVEPKIRVPRIFSISLGTNCVLFEMSSILNQINETGSIPMAWIKILDESEATGDLAEVSSEKHKQGLWRDQPLGEACFGTPFSVFTNNGTALK